MIGNRIINNILQQLSVIMDTASYNKYIADQGIQSNIERTARVQKNVDVNTENIRENKEDLISAQQLITDMDLQNIESEQLITDMDLRLMELEG